ncbi:MAG: SGNH/GDSL hydrolase family protein [Terracidiphilus sp.]
MNSRRITLSAALALALLAFSSVAQASSYSSVFVFGDSLSDNGNLYNAIVYPPSPYYDGRFSNGPVAVEQLSAMLGVPLVDFAYGGATTGVGNYIDGGSQTSFGSYGLPGMLAELAAAGPDLTPANLQNSLVIVWGGANDFFGGGSPTVAVTDLDSIVSTLEGDGATHILVPGMPDLGLTPEFYGDPTAIAYAQLFNTDLQASLPAGATYVDTFNLLQQIVANPGSYGLTNVTTPCFNGESVCSDPQDYLFWDGVHPTTAADTILADDFYDAATPEPSSILMLGTGLAGLAELLRRRRTA